MKIRQIKEAVDWEKVMEHNNDNIDRLARLRTQVNIDPVMEEVIDQTEKADKNSKEVFTKLAKDAESVTPKDPGTGKKITRKPYTEKLTLDEGLFSLNEDANIDLDVEDYTKKAIRNLVGNDYATEIADRSFIDDVIEDVKETSSYEADGNYNDDDIRLAIGRALIKRLSGESKTESLEEDYEEDLDLDDDMDEAWYHFEYKSGANPYIAKTEKERDRLLRKYKDKVKKVDDTSFVIDDVKKSSFDLDEDYERPIATMGLTNTSGIGIYDLNDEEVTFAFIDGSDKEPEKQTATVEYDCEDEEDCRPYFSVGDTKYFLDDFMRITESKSRKVNIKKKRNLDEAKDEDEEETVLDFVDSRLFGTNRNGSKPSSSNYRKVYNFLDDIQIPLKKSGKGGFSGSFFYPDTNSQYFAGTEGSGTKGGLGRRYPMFDDGIGIYLVDQDEEVLAKAVANELNFNYKLTPISSDKGFQYVAKIFIPESIMDMPVEEYLESIGKSLNQYKKSTGKRGRKARVSEE